LRDFSGTLQVLDHDVGVILLMIAERHVLA
jgi:hypothetical protein